MDISFHCGKCGNLILVDEMLAGNVIRCPTCLQPADIPRRATVSAVAWSSSAELVSSAEAGDPSNPANVTPSPTSSTLERELARIEVQAARSKSTLPHPPGSSSKLPLVTAVAVAIAIGAVLVTAFFDAGPPNKKVRFAASPPGKDSMATAQASPAAARFIAAAYETMGTIRGLNLSVRGSLSLRDYGEKVGQLAAGVEKLARVADEAELSQSDLYARKLCDKAGAILRAHQRALELWSQAADSGQEDSRDNRLARGKLWDEAQAEAEALQTMLTRF